ncbi:MAG: DUF4293 domain-containing protein [Flavipsychrobacter sp.]
MIQRIQSVWLLLAALVNAGLFYLSYYKAIFLTNGEETVKYLRATSYLPSLVVLIVITILPLVTIFRFKDRKKQSRMAVLSMIASIGFHALAIMRIGNINNSEPLPSDGSYQIGFFLPTIAIIFLLLAIKGIRKDEKLVKSLDRLR